MFCHYSQLLAIVLNRHICLDIRFVVPVLKKLEKLLKSDYES
jgi:hypothetical protein